MAIQAQAAAGYYTFSTALKQRHVLVKWLNDVAHLTHLHIRVE